MKGDNMRIVSLLLSSVLLAMMLSSVRAVEQPRLGGTFVVATTSDPSTYNMGTTVDWAPHEGSGADSIFDALVYFDMNYTAKPELARSWTTSSDGLTWTFNLVQNATWHDGMPFTSADVKFSIETLYLPYHPYASRVFACVNRIETPDNYTVIFKLKYPFASLLTYLSYNCGQVLPKHLYEGTNPLNNTHNLNPIGTGPFKFQEWVRGDHITLVKNENYYMSGLPYLDKIVIKIIPDSAARILALEKGEVDSLLPWAIPLQDFKRLTTLSGIHAEVPATWFSGANGIDINQRTPPLSDVGVRKAIAHAINRTFIHQTAFFGIGLLPTGPIGQDLTWCYEPNVTKYEYNVTEANRLLDQAGYSKGQDGTRFGLSLLYDVAATEDTRAAEVIKQNLKDVGIDITLKAVDRATLYDLYAVKWNFDLVIFKRSAGPDPYVALGRTYDSRNIKPVSGANSVGYNNTRVDTLFDMSGTEANQTIRAIYFREIQRILMEDLPMIPLWQTIWPMAASTKFHNIRTAINPFGSLREVWWEGGNATVVQPDEGFPMMYIYAAVGIAIVAVVGTAAVYFRRKRK